MGTGASERAAQRGRCQPRWPHASPPFQVLDHPKEANAWLFPQMNGIEVLYEAMSLLGAA